MQLGAFFDKYKKEIIITSSLLLISVISLIVISLAMPIGASVEVCEDGKLTAVYSLEADGEYSLLGGANILVIENGYAYIKEADCPDLTCVRTGKISKVGETIICLPHKLSVTVTGEAEEGPEIIPGAPSGGVS